MHSQRRPESHRDTFLMTPDLVQNLIDSRESLDVEFKSESRKQLPDKDLIEAVVCLANRTSTGPGWILVGVEDDGCVTGARPRTSQGEIDPVRIQSLIASRTRPSQTVQADVITLEEGDVLVIEVPASRHPVGTSDGRYLRRAIGGDGKPVCVPLHFHEIHSRQANLGLLDYTALPVPDAGWDTLDPREFVRFRGTIADNPSRADQVLLELSDIDIARALGAIQTEGDRVIVRVLGLLLFGRQEALATALPGHEIAFQRLSGERMKVNDFFRWPLLRAMDELEGRFRAANQEEEFFVGMIRIGVPDYPERAYREGVANALIHRDYARLGTVHVQWHDDRVQISSPGGLPEGVRLDNLLVTDPRPRNPRLADAFKRAGIVERTARGIDTIFREQLRGGRPAPSYDRSNETGVTLILPGGKANLDFVRLVVEEGRENGALNLQELLLLNHLWLERQTTSAEGAEVVQRTPAETRRHLGRLVEAGLVESRGRGKRQSYILASSTYRRLGLEAEYVRRRGFDPLQQEQLVLQYVNAHGRIARRHAAELCKIGPAQATRLLRRLVGKGTLAMHGQKRGTWYGPAED